MAEASVIGRGTRIRGRVAGEGDLEIHGYLEGEVTVGGELTVEGTAVVAANLSARRIVIRGAVRGDVAAEESLALDEGARVLGNIHAPRLALAQGALVRGEVEVGDADFLGAPRARAAAVTAVKASSVTSPTTPMSSPLTASRVATRPAAPVVVVPTSTKMATLTRASAEDRDLDFDSAQTVAISRPAGPPAPVVPALKKGAKGALTKKRG